MSGALHQFVLAVSLSPRGFGYVHFYGPRVVLDWGLKSYRGKAKNERILHAFKTLLAEHDPSTLVLERADVKGPRRGPRNRKLAALVIARARRMGVTVIRYRRSQIREAFAAVNPPTKYGIAQAIAARIPVLAQCLPPVRKIWMSEDPRQSLFDAASLALTYYASEFPATPSSHFAS